MTAAGNGARSATVQGGAMPPPLTCPERDCGRLMRLKQSRFGPFYGCDGFPRCGAIHGAHPDGTPLGTPADTPTKAARTVAHAAFDPLWMDALSLYPNIPERPRKARQAAIYNIRARARKRAYAWLALELDLPAEECHIGLFDRDTCTRVVKACMGSSAAAVRDWAKEKNL